MILELTTEGRLAQGGEAVARAPDGRVVFVRGAAPFERVRARVTETKPRFLRAVLEACLDPSPVRVTPPCSHFGDCGGCATQHIEPGAAAEAKLQAGLETLARVGGVRLESVPLWRGPALGGRTRARFAVEGGKVGFRAAGSHRVVRIDHCPILHPALDAARATIAELAAGGAGEVEVVTNGERVAASSSAHLYGLEGLEHRGLGPGPLLGADRAGPRYLAPELFSQASLLGNDALLEAVQAELPSQGRFALELYAGSGNFTRLLAARFERVVAVEGAAEAVRLGRRLGLASVQWRVGPVEREGGRALAERPDLVLVDPPRAGLPPALRSAAFPRLLYVSCDVGTLARDVAALSAHSELSSLRAFDLYPHTPHLEWLAVFERRPD